VTAAIYARKSTDQVVAHEQKSVTRQVEMARAFAERRGWTVLDEHVYTDDGISGAEFEKAPRPAASEGGARPSAALRGADRLRAEVARP